MATSNNHNGTTYNHDAIENAEISGCSKTTAAKIAGELDLTTVDSIEYRDGRDQYKVCLTTDGGLTAFGGGDCLYAIQSVVAQGNPETVTLWIVEKRV